MGLEGKFSMILEHSVVLRKKGCFKDVRSRTKGRKLKDVPTGQVVII